MRGIKRLTVATVSAALGAGLLLAPGASAAPAAPATAHTSSVNDCKSGYMCLWTGKNFSGRRLQYSDTGRWQNLPARAHSYYDRRGDDAAVAPGKGGSGGKTCVDGNSRNSYTRAGVASVYLAHTGSNC